MLDVLLAEPMSHAVSEYSISRGHMPVAQLFLLLLTYTYTSTLYYSYMINRHMNFRCIDKELTSCDCFLTYKDTCLNIIHWNVHSMYRVSIDTLMILPCSPQLITRTIIKFICSLLHQNSDSSDGLPYERVRLLHVHVLFANLSWK